MRDSNKDKTAWKRPKTHQRSTPFEEIQSGIFEDPNPEIQRRNSKFRWMLGDILPSFLIKDYERIKSLQPVKFLEKKNFEI